MSRDCSEQKNLKPKSCFKCKQIGHVSKECSSSKQIIIPNNLTFLNSNQNVFTPNNHNTRQYYPQYCYNNIQTPIQLNQLSTSFTFSKTNFQKQ